MLIQICPRDLTQFFLPLSCITTAHIWSCVLTKLTKNWLNDTQFQFDEKRKKNEVESGGMYSSPLSDINCDYHSHHSHYIFYGCYQFNWLHKHFRVWQFMAIVSLYCQNGLLSKMTESNDSWTKITTDVDSPQHEGKKTQTHTHTFLIASVAHPEPKKLGENSELANFVCSLSRQTHET